LEIGREVATAAVDLGAEVVEECDGVALLQKSPSQTGSDETSAASDEYVQKEDFLAGSEVYMYSSLKYSLAIGCGGNLRSFSNRCSYAPRSEVCLFNEADDFLREARPGLQHSIA
jgi:hypothetical protein